MKTSILRNGFLVGLPAVLAVFGLACSSSGPVEDDTTDEGALEQANEREAQQSAHDIAYVQCDADSWFGKGVALGSLDYKKLPADYESTSASDKQATLWSNISGTVYPDICKPDAGFGFLGKSIVDLVKGGLDKTWTADSDVLPEGRLKFLRPFGAAAEFEFEKEASLPYSGLLKGGEKVKGIVRFSNIGDEKQAGFVPGAGFKFLVDGKPSVNTMAMYSLLPQRVNGEIDRNFFRYPFRNWFPNVPEQAKIDHGGFSLKVEVTQLIFENSFGNKPNRLEVDDLAKVEVSGREVPQAERKNPRNLDFKPARALFDRFEAALAQNPNVDYRDFLKTVEPGTVAYEVYGYDDENPRTVGTKIGVIRLTSKVVSSAWSDYRLFFKHNPTGSKHDKEY